MADDQQENVLSAAFPAPPPFFKHFTPDNVKRVEAARAAASQNGDTSPSSIDAAIRKDSDLPSELHFLLPPEPPQSDEYRSFGETFNLTNPLPPPPPAASIIPRLDLSTLPTTPHTAIRPTLLRLTRSIMLAFLEIVSLLSTNPQFVEPKLRDLETLFSAAHTLVNEYRPHQARETLIEMMERRIATGRSEIEALRAMGRRVDEVLGGLGQGVEGDGVLEREGKGLEEARAEREKVEERERERRVWAALDEIEVDPPG